MRIHLAALMIATLVTNWTNTTPDYHPSTPTTKLTIARNTRATDGKALRLTLPANANASPAQGVGISSDENHQYGTFSTRMRSADCRQQRDAGVVTGAFTYADDGLDHDGDGIPDNDEIDIEFLCAQPQVVYLTIWTQYSETTDAFDATTRTIDLSTGTIISTCHRTSWAGGCVPLSSGEEDPRTIRAIRGFNSATTFRTYGFDWRADHVTYFTESAGRRIVLWHYRGPNIPDEPALFMQNVWHSANWDPIGRVAHEATTAPVSAYIDSTTITD